MEIERYSPRQQRAPAAQRPQIVAQFCRSGLTRAAFSRQHGVPLATLGWWLAKTKRASVVREPVAFREVRLVTVAGSAGSGWAMEVVGRSGVTVPCREALPVRDLARLLGGADAGATS